MKALLLGASALLLTAVSTGAWAGDAAAVPTASADQAGAPASAAPASVPSAAPAESSAAATTASAQAPAASSAPSSSAAAAEAPPAVAVSAVPPPPTGKGQVVFFRRAAFQGAAVWFKVRENGQELGKLSNGRYFIQAEEPGTHVYTAATENKDTLKLEVDPGETYYVEGQVTMGFFIGEAHLAPSDEKRFQTVMQGMKLAPPPPAQPQKAAAATP